MARRSLLTPERQKIIVDYLADGGYVRHACQRAGICEDTYLNWMRRGEKEGKGKFFRFFEACTHACTEAIRKNVKIVEAGAGPRKVKTKRTIRKADGTVEVVEIEAVEIDWRAAAWWLERRCPKEWGPQDKKVIVESDEPVRIKRGMPGPKD